MDSMATGGETLSDSGILRAPKSYRMNPELTASDAGRDLNVATITLLGLNPDVGLQAWV